MVVSRRNTSQVGPGHAGADVFLWRTFFETIRAHHPFYVAGVANPNINGCSATPQALVGQSPQSGPVDPTVHLRPIGHDGLGKSHRSPFGLCEFLNSARGIDDVTTDRDCTMVRATEHAELHWPCMASDS